MNEVELKDRLHDAYDTVPAWHGSVGDDLARARRARRRQQAARAGAGATATVAAVTVAVATLSGGGPRAEIAPAAGGLAQSTSTSVPTATGSPTSWPPQPAASTSTSAEVEVDDYLERMFDATRAELSDGADYLGSWPSGPGAGQGFGNDESGRVESVRLSVNWSVKSDDRNNGSILVEAARGPREGRDSIRCGGSHALLPPGECHFVRTIDGAKLYYAETATVRSVSIEYPDGDEVSATAKLVQEGNSVGATSAPLPPKDELVAIALTPGLRWPGAVG